MNIYLASSWRNKLYAEVLAALRLAGHEVYDFKNPSPENTGFSWHQIGDRFGKCAACGETDPVKRAGLCGARMAEREHEWEGGWDARHFANEVLDHPISAKGFTFDMNALDAASACVLVEPCGRSAHLELGYAVGQRKLTVVYFPELDEPELMIRMCDYVETTLSGLLRVLTNDRPTPRWQRDVASYDAQFKPNGSQKVWYETMDQSTVARETYAAVDEIVGPCRPYLHRICKGCGECWRHRRCTCKLINM